MKTLPLIVIALAIVGFNPVASAKPKPAPAPKPAAAPPAEEPKKEEPKKDPKVAEYEAAIKDLNKIDGAFPLYIRKKEILMEMNDAMFGREFLLQATINTGVSSINAGLQAGMPLGADTVDVFRFEKLGEDKVVLKRPNLRYRWTKDSPWAVASDRAFPEAMMGDYRVEATNPETKKILVNVTSLFQGDVLRINELVQAGLGPGYFFDRERSTVDSIKPFPDTAVVRMNLHFMSARGGPEADNPFAALMAILVGPNNLEDRRSAPMKVTLNLTWRKKSDYQPRLADPRVGFFTVDFFDLKRFNETDKTQRYIERWDMRKKHPEEAMSEPVKPMIWVIDNSVPIEYREAARAGILSWNKAFEKIGIKNALQVIDPPSDGSYDHADGRYNVYRWTVTNGGDPAIALFRTDPYTGEIINAAIDLDAGWVNVGIQEYDKMFVPAASDNVAAARSMLLKQPGQDSFEKFDEIFAGKDPAKAKFDSLFKKFGWRTSMCDLGDQRHERLIHEMMALDAMGIKISKKDYIDQVIATTTVHEVGHCLGLRHNFVASTNLTTKQLADDDLVRIQGVGASVMDYMPANNVAFLKGGGTFYTWDPAPADDLAIEYGYKSLGTMSPEKEVPYLRQIAMKSNQHGLEYMTDENADNVDPYVQLWDLGSDNLNYNQTEFEMARRIRKYAIEKLPRPGESYAERNAMILSSYRRMLRASTVALRYLGGVRGSRALKGDPVNRGTLQPVDAATQRQAIRQLCNECLSLDALNLPDSVIRTMSVDYNQPTAAGWNAPLRTILGSQIKTVVYGLMSASMGSRILENEFKDANPYTLREHYSTIAGKVFGDIGSNKPISTLRRDAQQAMLDGLIEQAGANSMYLDDDTRILASTMVVRLQARFRAAYASYPTDDATKNHLGDMIDRIDRFMRRQRVTAG